MAITSETMNEIFAETSNDMEQIVSAAKESFYRPELDRETVRMWLELPLLLKEAITEKNPALAKRLDKKVEQYRKGEVSDGISI